MQLVIKDGKVLAIHDDSQVIDYPGCEVTFHDTVVQVGDPDPRTPQERANCYRDQRRRAYPPIAEQLDMMHSDAVNGTTTWRDTISAIKTRYPKD